MAWKVLANNKSSDVFSIFILDKSVFHKIKDLIDQDETSSKDVLTFINDDVTDNYASLTFNCFIKHLASFRVSNIIFLICLTSTAYYKNTGI